jgi:hypothetical protein
MASTAYAGALSAVCRRFAAQSGLEVQSIAWAVSGSVALSLHGIAVDCRDLDILTAGDSATAVSSLLAGTEIEPVEFRSRGGLRGFTGRVRLEAMDVEILGDVENELPDGRWSPPPRLDRDVERLAFAGQECPVMSLSALRDAYAAMGRPEKVALIEGAI